MTQCANGGGERNRWRFVSGLAAFVVVVVIAGATSANAQELTIDFGEGASLTARLVQLFL